MLLFLCFVSLIAQSLAQYHGDGACPIRTQKNFDRSKSAGGWIEYARIPNQFEPDHVCTNATLSFNNDNSGLVHVDATIRLSGAWFIWEGKLFPTDTKGVFELQFPRYSTTPPSIATIINSNSNRFLIFVLCADVDGNNQQDAWIFTKRYEITRRDYREIDSVLRTLNLSWDLFKISDNHNCPEQRPLIHLPN